MQASDSPVFDAILSRRSVRAYERIAVPRDIIERLVTAAIWAPSGSNRQETAFVAVTDPAELTALQPFAPGMRGSPPAVLVACIDRRRLPAVAGAEQVTEVVHMDVAMAVESLLLAAHALGLGACVIHSFRPAAVAGSLSLPPCLKPSLLVALGYPARIPPAPTRRPLDEVLLWGRQQAILDMDSVAAPAGTGEAPPAGPAPAASAPVVASDAARDGTLHVVWLLSSARGLMDEPLRYGPMRLMDAACRFGEYLERRGLADAPASRVLDGLRAQRERGSTGYSEMGAALDASLAELARGM